MPYFPDGGCGDKPRHVSQNKPHCSNAGRFSILAASELTTALGQRCSLPKPRTQAAALQRRWRTGRRHPPVAARPSVSDRAGGLPPAAPVLRPRNPLLRLRRHSSRSHHISQNSEQLKTYELFISGISHLIFLDPW